MSRRRVFAMVLAAGPSRRMGRPKLLLEYAGGTILEAMLDAVFESAVDGALIVTTAEIENLLRESLPSEAAVIVNHDLDSDVVTSAKLGISKARTLFHAQDDDGVVVLPGDMPEIGAGTITMCAEMYRMAKQPRMLVSTYHGERGYPVVSPFSKMLEIFCWERPRPLEDLWERPGSDVRELPIGLGPRPIDVDTAEDYARLCAMHATRLNEPAEGIPMLRYAKGDDEAAGGDGSDMPDDVARSMDSGETTGADADMRISIVERDEDIAACWEVMSELRPQIRPEEFVSRVRRQQQGGYILAKLEADGRVCSLAGFRLGENLPWGQFLYVDDLVSASAERSKGYGEALFAWLVEEARRHDCDALHLDSGVQRFGAHRFYLDMRMDITSHHFAIKLKRE